ncbi:hypothetical protein M011DRAFT_472550 [Sporormia fimetaria CBS 119925]|uniref:Uncharacterized protein n=1 Tax=Sporormia fimetaria CBS 119925 TaxID=1340428 RepID=A0A6A6UYH8_9PLEO|nr:hypothetical protein M011DRAFT_472550 [Sporormia fimetaria CBS 119925]
MDSTNSKKRTRDSESYPHRRTRHKLSSDISPSHELSGALPLRPSEPALSDSESNLSESSEDPSSESSIDDGEDDSEDTDDSSDRGSASAHSTPDDAHADEDIINLRANRGEKPPMRLDKNDLGPDIRDFLKDFLPQLKAANEELEAERRAGTLRDREIEVHDDAEDHYIEMDLGLGVLEERDSDAAGASGSSSASSSDTEEHKKADVMGKLLGRREPAEKASIEEIDETDAK